MNRSIDDENGDSVTGAKPSYLPDEGWSQGAQCPGCHVNPTLADVSRAFDQTWHDGTYHPGQPDRTITVSFTGTAVFVYNLIANVIQYTTTLTNLSFSIDGTYMQQYMHVPDGSEEQILYSVLVFSHTGLANQPHTLEMRAAGLNDSLILFDVVLYTVPEDPSPAAQPQGSSTSTLTTVSSTSESSASSQSTSPAAGDATSSTATTQHPPETGEPIVIRRSDSTHSDTISSGLTSASTTSEPNSQPLSDTVTMSVVPSSNPSSIVSGTLEASGTPNTSPAAIQGHRSLSASAIVGLMAGLVGFGLIVLFLCVRRRCRRRTGSGSPPVDRSMPKKRARSLPAIMNMLGPRDSTIAVTSRMEPAHVPSCVASQTQGHPFASNHFIPRAGDLSSASGRLLRFAERDAADAGIPDSTSSKGNLTSPTSELQDNESQRTGSTIGALRSQVARLQEQLEHLRYIEQDMTELFSEPPPSYEDRNRDSLR
ncbi:hypothetical protein ONZ51_g8467 [Trametes cubensis]|uniref:Uncharacterized protein n=1 Tax=Trametes cubensis TaxID=1111947 RepID=A0AAD7TN78_9APHY|nr:hypothetical protein ONZ51_g8467 [Trametes cubensis]